MIDAHCHLNNPDMLEQVPAMLERMAAAGVTGAVVAGYDLPSSYRAVELAQRYPQLRAVIGVHPHDSDTIDDALINELRELARAPQVLAIGEIGLDYHYDHSPREVQRTGFRQQLALAAELGLPVVIHEREAIDDALQIMDAEGGWARGGHWHCGSVEPEIGLQIATHMYVGIAGWVTFKKAENIRALAAALPLQRILLETDAPYLAPIPHRGKTNEPAHLPLIAAAVAELHGVTVAEVAEQTGVNTVGAFLRWGVTAGL